MKNAPVDEPIRDENEDDDLEANPEATIPAAAVGQPAIVAAVGSSDLGSVDVEPQEDRHPDNDGETVEE